MADFDTEIVQPEDEADPLFRYDKCNPEIDKYLYNGEEAPGFFLPAIDFLVLPDDSVNHEDTEIIVRTTLCQNTLIALPKYSGFVVILPCLFWNFNYRYPLKKCIFVSVKSTIAESMLRNCNKHFGISNEQSIFLNNTIKKNDRIKYWKERSFFFTDPDLLLKDLVKGICRLEDIRLIVYENSLSSLKSYLKIIDLLRPYRSTIRTVAQVEIQDLHENFKNLEKLIKSYGCGALELRTYKRILVEETIIPDVSINRLCDLLLSASDKYFRLLKEFKILRGNFNDFTASNILRAKNQFSKTIPENNLLPIDKIKTYLSICYHVMQCVELMINYGIKSANEKIDNCFDLFNNNLSVNKLLQEDECYQKFVKEAKSNSSSTSIHPKVRKITKLFEKEENSKFVIFCSNSQLATEIFDNLKNISYGNDIWLESNKQEFVDNKSITKNFASGLFRVLIFVNNNLHKTTVFADIVVFIEATPESIDLINKIIFYKIPSNTIQYGRLYLFLTENEFNLLKGIDCKRNPNKFETDVRQSYDLKRLMRDNPLYSLIPTSLNNAGVLGNEKIICIKSVLSNNKKIENSDDATEIVLSTRNDENFNLSLELFNNWVASANKDEVKFDENLLALLRNLVKKIDDEISETAEDQSNCISEDFSNNVKSLGTQFGKKLTLSLKSDFRMSSLKKFNNHNFNNLEIYKNSPVLENEYSVVEPVPENNPIVESVPENESSVVKSFLGNYSIAEYVPKNESSIINFVPGIYSIVESIPINKSYIVQPVTDRSFVESVPKNKFSILQPVPKNNSIVGAISKNEYSFVNASGIDLFDSSENELFTNIDLIPNQDSDIKNSDTDRFFDNNETHILNEFDTSFNEGKNSKMDIEDELKNFQNDKLNFVENFDEAKRENFEKTSDQPDIGKELSFFKNYELNFEDFGEADIATQLDETFFESKNTNNVDEFKNQNFESNLDEKYNLQNFSAKLNTSCKKLSPLKNIENEAEEKVQKQNSKNKAPLWGFAKEKGNRSVIFKLSLGRKREKEKFIVNSGAGADSSPKNNLPVKNSPSGLGVNISPIPKISSSDIECHQTPLSLRHQLLKNSSPILDKSHFSSSPVSTSFVGQSPTFVRGNISKHSTPNSAGKSSTSTTPNSSVIFPKKFRKRRIVSSSSDSELEIENSGLPKKKFNNKKRKIIPFIEDEAICDDKFTQPTQPEMSDDYYESSFIDDESVSHNSTNMYAIYLGNHDRSEFLELSSDEPPIEINDSTIISIHSSDDDSDSNNFKKVEKKRNYDHVQ